MNKRKREATKRSAELNRQQSIAVKQRKAEEAQKREEKIRQQIAKNNKQTKYNEGEISESPLLRTVGKKAPKLLEKDYINHVRALERDQLENGIPWQRDPQDWKPKGKGKYSLFVSLAEHLFAKYHTPKFLWSAFWEENANTRFLSKIVERIAGGESFAKMCKSGEFPLPFTKKQCHMFLQTTANYRFMSALRRIQIKSHGGSSQLHQAWMQRPFAQYLGTQAEEVFWDSVIAWFSKNPMLDLNQLGPLIDYINHRRADDGDFSMKGRSALAMLRGMEEWHGELQRIKEFKAHNYESTGFKPGRYQIKKRLRIGHITENWTIDEILTSSELAAEGRVQKHCVYSYSRSIASGQISIWSMKMNGERMITIEVWNKPKTINQTRGKHNRATTADEFRIIQRWAQENGFEFRVRGW